MTVKLRSTESVRLTGQRRKVDTSRPITSAAMNAD